MRAGCRKRQQRTQTSYGQLLAVQCRDGDVGQALLVAGVVDEAGRDRGRAVLVRDEERVEHVDIAMFVGADGGLVLLVGLGFKAAGAEGQECRSGECGREATSYGAHRLPAFGWSDIDPKSSRRSYRSDFEMVTLTSGNSVCYGSHTKNRPRALSAAHVILVT